MVQDDGLTLIASQFAGIGVDRFHRADITFAHLRLIIAGDLRHLVARRNARRNASCNAQPAPPGQG